MRIVSFSLVVPYVGIPHAGGEYYRRHLAALRSLGHDVVTVAPETELNRIGRARTEDPGRVLLVPCEGSRGLRIADRVAAVLVPHWLAPSSRRALRRSPAVQDALGSAEFVEAQWEEMAFLLHGVNRPTALISHDVPLQRELRWLRAARAQRAPRKVVWRAWRVCIVALTQPASFRGADVVITLSDKDAAQVRRASRRPRVVAIDPPLWDPSEHPEPPVDGSASARIGPVVFVAAFDRRENVEAAEWLLDEVWPTVLRTLPETGLALVGAHPPESLQRRAALTAGVAVSGYVDDLDEVYRMASAAVVPLHSGAGVKFKTIDALLRGLPVVSTTVGAEGITDDEGRFPYPVTDDPQAFAAAVIAALHAVPAAHPEVTQWARTRYGTQRYARRLVEAMPALGGDPHTEPSRHPTP
jgi:glycosyltransferase involved in cell wall biosynthesis